tara:strand:- start:2136 stop:2525 length:390 start_codon:yes stop_codon:yes gene_type:complete
MVDVTEDVTRNVATTTTTETSTTTASAINSSSASNTVVLTVASETGQTYDSSIWENINLKTGINDGVLQVGEAFYAEVPIEGNTILLPDNQIEVTIEVEIPTTVPVTVQETSQVATTTLTSTSTTVKPE